MRTSDKRRRIRRHVENLDSLDQNVAARAEGYLIRYYGARALVELLDACRHLNPVVRFRAVWALGETRDPRAYEAILRLTDDPDERVRYDATLALGVLGDMRAAEPLLQIWFENDESRPAAMAISRLGAKALRVVEAALRRGNAGVRQAAVSVLGDFARDGDARCTEFLRESLDDPDLCVRADAAYWLEETGEAGCEHEKSRIAGLEMPTDDRACRTPEG